MRDKAMNTQVNVEFDIDAVVRAANAYASASETIERAMESKFENRKILVDFIRSLNGEWTTAINKKVKASIDALPPGICSDKTGLLGVLKTCTEYGIMPVTVNANRLRKIHKTWTTLDGKTIPNGYKNVHTKPGAGQKATAPTATAPATTAPATTAPATTAPATTAPATTAAQTTPKVPSISPATPQKASEPTYPIASNISSADEPLSSREDFKVKMIHLFKNETFRDEYCTLLATMLDIEKATLTRCMFQACDAIKV